MGLKFDGGGFLFDGFEFRWALVSVNDEDEGSVMAGNAEWQR